MMIRNKVIAYHFQIGSTSISMIYPLVFSGSLLALRQEAFETPFFVTFPPLLSST